MRLGKNHDAGVGEICGRTRQRPRRGALAGTACAAMRRIRPLLGGPHANAPFAAATMARAGQGSVAGMSSHPSSRRPTATARSRRLALAASPRRAPLLRSHWPPPTLPARPRSSSCATAAGCAGLRPQRLAILASPSPLPPLLLDRAVLRRRFGASRRTARARHRLPARPRPARDGRAERHVAGPRTAPRRRCARLSAPTLPRLPAALPRRDARRAAGAGQRCAARSAPPSCFLAPPRPAPPLRRTKRPPRRQKSRQTDQDRSPVSLTLTDLYTASRRETARR